MGGPSKSGTRGGGRSRGAEGGGSGHFGRSINRKEAKQLESELFRQEAHAWLTFRHQTVRGKHRWRWKECASTLLSGLALLFQRQIELRRL